RGGEDKRVRVNVESKQGAAGSHRAQQVFSMSSRAKGAIHGELASLQGQQFARFKRHYALVEHTDSSWFLEHLSKNGSGHLLALLAQVFVCLAPRIFSIRLGSAAS